MAAAKSEAPIINTKPAALYSIIVASTRTHGIGNAGGLPWPKLSDDMKLFRKLTTDIDHKLPSLHTPSSDASTIGSMNAVIMGRKTWDSIPAAFRPLKGRLNIIITSNPAAITTSGDVKTASSFANAIQLCMDDQRVAHVYIGGGSQVYRDAISFGGCQRVYLTQVLKEYPCDTHFEFDASNYTLTSVGDLATENGVPYQFLTYVRKTTPAVAPPSAVSEVKGNAEEQQYLDLVRDVIFNGTRKSDRTGVGTVSKFGCTSRYSLRDGRIPLLTTKRVFWRGVVEELIWLINGRTSAKELQTKGVRIWDGNGTKAFLESIGQGHREEFDLGPIYGHQWRFFGAQYVDCHTDYKGKGVDQLAEVVDLIKKSPDSRRIVMSAWNPTDLKQMALPPCHVLCQFYVANGELSCIMYQRSCDLGLGVPFNIASYSLLTHIMAHVCGLRAGDFVHMMGDTHVYLNHVEPLKEQIARTPTAFPRLNIKRPITEIGAWTFDDVEVIDYKPQGPIKMDMAV